MRKYLECTVNTGSLFDEDGDPIFNMQVPSTPVSPVSTAGKQKKGSKKTGCLLKRTLSTSSTRRKKAPKTTTEVQDQAEVLPPSQATAPPSLAVDTAPVIQTTPPAVTTPA